MASLREKVEEARKAGYSDQDIQKFLLGRPEASAAKKEGYSEQEILQHFGLGAAPAETKPTEAKPAEITGLRRTALQSVHSLRKGLAEGLGVGGTLQQLGNELLPEGVKYWLPPVQFPTPQEVESGLGWQDLQAQHPELAPQGAGEEYAQAGLRGLGAALPAVLAAGATGGAAIPLALAGTAGGLSGELAKKTLPGVPMAEPIAGMLGGLAVGGMGSAVSGAAAAKQLAERTAGAENALLASKEALRVARQGSSSAVAAGREESALTMQQALREAEAKASELTSHADEITRHVASVHGTSETLQEAGTKLQEGARDWLSRIMPQKQDQIWSPLNAAVPGDTQTSLFSFSRALNEINQSGGKLEPLTALLKPGLPARLQKTLDDILASPAGTKGVPAKTAPSAILNEKGEPIIKTVKEAVPPKPVTWEEVQKLRSALGESLSVPAVVDDIGRSNLKKLYASLSQDMRGAAAENGAAELFDEANAQSKALFDIAEGPISRIVKGPRESAADLKPEDAVSRLLAGGKKGASDLETLRAEMPAVVREVTAAGLRSNPKFWQELSPEAKQALVPEPRHARALDLAQTARERSKTDLAESRRAAAEAHRKAVADVQKATRAEIEGKVEAFEAAKQEVNALQPQAKPPPSGEYEVVKAILGEGIGQHALTLMLSPFGLSGPAINQLGGVLGAAAPLVGRGLGAAIEKPARLLYPAVGAMGANALGGR